MKKIFLCPVLAMMMATGFMSCQKEGPAGPSGSSGPQGIQGPAGEDGQDAQVQIFVKDFKVTTTAWKGGKEHASLDIPEITNEVMTGGIVLGYIIMEDQLFMLPYKDGHELFRHSFGIGKATVWREPADGSSVGKPQKDRHFRIVIVPNVVSGRVESSNILDLLSTEHLNEINRRAMNY